MMIIATSLFHFNLFWSIEALLALAIIIFGIYVWRKKEVLLGICNIVVPIAMHCYYFVSIIGYEPLLSEYERFMIQLRAGSSYAFITVFLLIAYLILLVYDIIYIAKHRAPTKKIK